MPAFSLHALRSRCSDQSRVWLAARARDSSEAARALYGPAPEPFRQGAPSSWPEDGARRLGLLARSLSAERMEDIAENLGTHFELLYERAWAQARSQGAAPWRASERSEAQFSQAMEEFLRPLARHAGPSFAVRACQAFLLRAQGPASEPPSELCAPLTRCLARWQSAAEARALDDCAPQARQSESHRL